MPEKDLPANGPSKKHLKTIAALSYETGQKTSTTNEVYADADAATDAAEAAATSVSAAAALQRSTLKTIGALSYETGQN